MRKIEIRKTGITELDTDAIVNAANRGLMAGSGVCGAIFREAGHAQLQEACNKIGHCPTGQAVITPGFRLKARYVIHAVGPIWSGGRNGEPELLYSAYYNSLALAVKNQCTSVGFPLISAGIYGYPMDLAWKQAIKACRDFLNEYPGIPMQIVFAVLEDRIMKKGKEVLAAEAKEFQ